MRSLLSLAMLLICGAVSADRFDDFVKAKMEEQRIPGLQFVVVSKGKISMSRSYGYADVEGKKPVVKETAFEIASVSKPILATAVMMLSEEGKLSINDPVGKYIKEMPLAWASVPIRNLLSHTSGVPEYRSGEFFVRHRFEETPFTDITKQMSTDLRFDPGDHFSYSNTNYLLLAKAIEGVTGKPYTEFLKSRIFDPLGMTSTGFVGSKDHATGYTAVGHNFMANRDCSLIWSGPGASIVSTCEDMAKFDAALDSAKLIKNTTLVSMFQPTFTKLGSMDYGLGWQVEKVNGMVVGMHAGKMNGFASMYIRLLNERISVIVLSNSSDIDGNAMTRGILGLYFPEMNSQKMTPIVDDDPDLTLSHTKLIQSIAARTPDMDAFTDDYKAHISEEKLKAMGSELARGGPIKPLQIVRRYTKGQFEVYVYLMSQGQSQLILTVIMDSKGKVAGLTLAAP